MPDPLSIALGVVQVAETGFRLANTIYKYTNSVRKAEEQLRPVADYVKLTCTVLEQVAYHLEDKDLTALYKPALLVSAQDAIQGCERAFESLRLYLTTLTKDGGTKTTTKLTWSWKRKELDNHQVHLERYKSTFDLLLSTLTFVSSSRTAKDTLAMKIELQRLMNIEAEAKRKEAMLPSVEPLEPGSLPRYTSLPDIDSTRAIDAVDEPRAESSSRALGPSALGFMNNAAIAAVQMPPTGPKTDFVKDALAPSTIVKNEQTDIEDALLARLNECALAMDKLSATLNHTISQWAQSGHYQRESLLPNFQLLHSAIKRVSALELLDTRTQSRGPKGEPISREFLCSLALTTASNNLQTSRSQHFIYEPISLPGSRPGSPLQSDTATPARIKMTAGSGVTSHQGSLPLESLHSPPLTPAGSENRPAPAWNSRQYGYIGVVASKSRASGFPFLSRAEKEKLLQQRATQEQRQKPEANEAERRQKKQLEVEEEQAKMGEERRWEEVSMSTNKPDVSQKNKWTEQEPIQTATTCTYCGTGTPLSDDDQGNKICTECFLVVMSASNTVAEVEFDEDLRGVAQVQGGFVNENARHAKGYAAKRRIGRASSQPLWKPASATSVQPKETSSAVKIADAQHNKISISNRVTAATERAEEASAGDMTSSPSSGRARAPLPVALVTSPTHRQQRIPEEDENDEAAYSSIEDARAFQSAIGFAGLSFKASSPARYSDSDEMEEVPRKPPRANKPSRPSFDEDMDFVGHTYKRENEASKTSGVEDIVVGRPLTENISLVQRNEETTSHTPSTARSRSRSRSDRSMSRSRSRSWRQSMSPKRSGGLAGGAAVGAFAGYVSGTEKKYQDIVMRSDGRRRSRSRRRAVSADSANGGHAYERRTRQAAMAGIAGAATAGLVERTPSKSRKRRGSSVIRGLQDAPIAAAGLGGAALAGLYEKSRAMKEAKRDALIDAEMRNRGRSRSRTRVGSGVSPSGSAATAPAHESDIESEKGDDTDTEAPGRNGKSLFDRITPRESPAPGVSRKSPFSAQMSNPSQNASLFAPKTPARLGTSSMTTSNLFNKLPSPRKSYGHRDDRIDQGASQGEYDRGYGLARPLNMPELPKRTDDTNFTLEALSKRLEGIEQNPQLSARFALSGRDRNPPPPQDPGDDHERDHAPVEDIEADRKNQDVEESGNSAISEILDHEEVERQLRASVRQINTHKKASPEIPTIRFQAQKPRDGEARNTQEWSRMSDLRYDLGEALAKAREESQRKNAMNSKSSSRQNEAVRDQDKEDKEILTTRPPMGSQQYEDLVKKFCYFTSGSSKDRIPKQSQPLHEQWPPNMGCDGVDDAASDTSSSSDDVTSSPLFASLKESRTFRRPISGISNGLSSPHTYAGSLLGAPEFKDVNELLRAWTSVDV